MDEFEQERKFEDLSNKLEDLADKLNGLIEEREDDEETPDFEEVTIGERSFLVHWVEDTEYSTISNMADAKAAFLAAAQDRDSSSGKAPVGHGDFMVIGTSCPWLAVCITVDSWNQREDPHAPEVAESDEVTIGSATVVQREFMVWSACGDPTVGDPCIPSGAETSVPYVEGITYTPPTLVNGVKTHVITFTKRILKFDSCGCYLRSDSDSPETITINECCEEEEEESDCNDGLSDTYTFTPAGGSPVTVTRLPHLGGTLMGCDEWYSDPTITWQSDYVLFHDGASPPLWSIGGTQPPVTCPGAQVNLFGKIGGASNNPIGGYDCLGNPGVSVGAIS